MLGGAVENRDGCVVEGRASGEFEGRRKPKDASADDEYRRWRRRRGFHGFGEPVVEVQGGLRMGVEQTLAPLALVLDATFCRLLGIFFSVPTTSEATGMLNRAIVSAKVERCRGGGEV